MMCLIQYKKQILNIQNKSQKKFPKKFSDAQKKFEMKFGLFGMSTLINKLNNYILTVYGAKKNVTNGTTSDNFKSLARIFKLVYRYKMISIAKTKNFTDEMLKKWEKYPDLLNDNKYRFLILQSLLFFFSFC